MRIILSLSIIINILSILILILGFLTVNKSNIIPKYKALLGIFMGITMLFYLIFLSLLALTGFYKHNLLMSSLIIFVFIPFIIGKFAKYEKLKKYTFLQILSYLISLSILIFCL